MSDVKLDLDDMAIWEMVKRDHRPAEQWSAERTLGVAARPATGIRRRWWR
jgi:hypothetical protein